MPVHQDLAQGGWQRLTLAQQLGNIGSEISRANRWKEKNNKEYSQQALERGLELFDLTLADGRWSGHRRELCRAREVVCDFFAGDNAYHSTSKNLQAYFDAFAVQAQMQSQTSQK